MVKISVILLLAIIVSGIVVPWILNVDPIRLDPGERLRGPDHLHWLGTDPLGRDLFARIIYGSRVSLSVGFLVVLLSLLCGTFFGAISGYFRMIDGIVMRFMDGIMAIPSILLAIGLVAAVGSSLSAVVVGIAIPQVPRVSRVVRGVIMSAREEPYVEAAAVMGGVPWTILMRHMLPSTVPLLIVHGTYIFAAAIMYEAYLSFLGVGIPPETPSWGNVIATGRSYFQIIPGLVLYAGVVLSVTILAINIIGDAARDVLDPKLALSRDE